MPRPRLRTRSRKRVCTTLPSGKSTIHYKKEITPPKTCSSCGQRLAGTPADVLKLRKLNQTRRRIQRMHGGHLCHNCLKKAIKQGARAL